MITIERYYLIDYENVGAGGLIGSNTLKRGEHVIIFFTPNAKKIDMSSIANLGGADLEMIEVPAGKQSTDIHIGSYIGFLSGVIDERKRSMQKYPEAQVLEREFSVVIVSKDKDYDNVLKFWKDKTGIKVARTEAIKPSRSEKDAVVKAEPVKTEAKKSAAPETAKEQAPKEQTLKEKATKQTASKRKKKTGKVTADDITKQFEKLAQEIEAASKATENQAGEKTAKKAVKKAESKKAESKKPEPGKVAKPGGEELVAVNNQIQKVLSKAKIASEVIGYVAPLAVKKHGSEDGKQQVYKTLVAKYGQEQGLNIYNHIKKIL